MPRQPRPRVAVPALMHATELPRFFHRHAWVYEEKYDGWNNQVRFTSRNSVDHAQCFPDLVKGGDGLDAPSLTLGGA